VCGPTVPPDLHSAQATMLPSRPTTFLWTGNFRQPRGYRRPSLPPGSRQCFKRGYSKPPYNVVPPDPAGFYSVDKPSDEQSRRTRNFGRHSIRNACHRRINGRLGCNHAFFWEMRSLRTASTSRRYKYRSTPKHWDVISRTRSVYAQACGTSFLLCDTRTRVPYIV
jgi:hypothetical protein